MPSGGAQSFSARIRDVSQQLETVEQNPGAGATASSDIRFVVSSALWPACGRGAARNVRRHSGTGVCAARRFGAMLWRRGNLQSSGSQNSSSRVLEGKAGKRCRTTARRFWRPGILAARCKSAPGALLAGMEFNVCHPVELLDQAYAQAGLYRKPVRST